ncbi:hypothetical protein D3C86_1962140 [compost metagenome]
MPILSEVNTEVLPGNEMGVAMLAMILSAMGSASSVLCNGVSRTANSSPPRHATRSSSRNCARTRVATATSTASPAAWPKLSLNTTAASTV